MIHAMGPYILINCDDDDNGGSHCGDSYIQDGDDNGPGNDGDRQQVCFENDRSNLDAKMVSAILTISDLFAKVTATASEPRTSAGERTVWKATIVRT